MEYLQHLPAEPAVLKQLLPQAYDQFMSACQSLSPEQAQILGVCGTWCAREVVAHLTGWQVESTAALKASLVYPEIIWQYHPDGFNALSLHQRRFLTWQQVLSNLKKA